MVPLVPLSFGELLAARRAPGSLEELPFRGLYPPIYDRKLEPRIWYGNYVQTYVERDVPVEIKSAQTVASDFFDGINDWVRIAGEASGRPWLVYGGDARQARGPAEVLPWREIDELAASSR